MANQDNCFICQAGSEKFGGVANFFLWKKLQDMIEADFGNIWKVELAVKLHNLYVKETEESLPSMSPDDFLDHLLNHTPFK